MNLIFTKDDASGYRFSSRSRIAVASRVERETRAFIAPCNDRTFVDPILHADQWFVTVPNVKEDYPPNRFPSTRAHPCGSGAVPY